MIREAIRDVVERHDLSTEVAHQVMLEMVKGEAVPSQIGSFVTAMRMKGETEQELKGFAMAMRELAVKVNAPDDTVDLCGTGGDGSNSFNISTVASFVVAGAGVPVAKHGNRSVSSSCGSADVLSALGLPVDLDGGQVERCLSMSGMCFMYAPVFHSSMKNVLGPRREIGVRTFFNVLGPMTNPACVKRQLIGVYDQGLSRKIAGVLASLGSSHVMIVNGCGMDEITNIGETRVLEVKDGTCVEYSLEPSEFGLDLADPEDLKGGNPDQNARMLLSILKGERSPRADVVSLNAAAAIYVSGRVGSIQDGFQVARATLESGRALAKLKEFSDSACAIEKERQRKLDVDSLRGRRVLPEVLVERAPEITSSLSTRVSESERGQAILDALDPDMLSRPSALSVIVLNRILRLLRDGYLVEEKHARGRKSLANSIESSPGIAVIAEYKPRSPSSPALHVPPDPNRVAMAYSSAPLAGVSVLAEPDYFSGGPEAFSFIRERVDRPLLFKDFIVTEEHLSMASALGADAVLLIAKSLRPETLDGLITACGSCKLEPIVEVHDEKDIAKLSSVQSLDSVRMIGINCRDLRTMRTDVDVLSRLMPSLPRDKLLIAESGIRSSRDLPRIRQADAVLVGSMFMQAEDLSSQLTEFVNACRSVG